MPGLDYKSWFCANVAGKCANADVLDSEAVIRFAS